MTSQATSYTIGVAESPWQPTRRHSQDPPPPADNLTNTARFPYTCAERDARGLTRGVFCAWWVGRGAGLVESVVWDVWGQSDVAAVQGSVTTATNTTKHRQNTRRQLTSV
ncbi:hypothetical protein Pmani_017177 [Petrolisthes manimaculis]|uniref:Uncharacterized protein n=1 Tax=Petrolisthes manimaculis TaxID=1843537 RepID=A0AAE1PQ29_9EUCA|nr:hypothetical protein Pmani_017177 [Petrolisthes manimaculis]